MNAQISMVVLKIQFYYGVLLSLFVPEGVGPEREHRPVSQTVSQPRMAADTTDHHQPTGQPCRNKAWGPKKYYYWNHPLQLMV